MVVSSGGKKAKDIRRLTQGFSLIAKEFANRSPALQNAKNADFQSLLKNAVVSLTDLTKGTLHSTKTTATCPSNPNKSDFIVFFTHADEPLPPSSLAPPQPEPEKPPQPPEHNAAVSEVVVASASQPEPVRQPETQLRSPEPQPQPLPLPPPLPRRNPRERRVPSTPLSRALGFAGFGAGLAWGTLHESTKRLIYGMPPASPGGRSAASPFLSEQNALTLCRKSKTVSCFVV